MTSGRGDRVYCTYFDSRYVPRAYAMVRSLRAVGESAAVIALCFDDAALRSVRSWDLGEVEAVSLADFEQRFPQVAAVREGRSTAEYFFTCTPWLVDFVLEQRSPTWVTYLDADLWFVSPPDPIYEEIADGVCGVIPHGYPPRLKKLEKYGRYNVGWVSFRNCPEGRSLISWWGQMCLEWCFDSPEPGRYADQGYLDSFASVTSGVVDIEHPGANLAPWNLAVRRVARDVTGPTVSTANDSSSSTSMDFVGRAIATWRVTSSSGRAANRAVKDLYRAYVAELVRAERINRTSPPAPSRRGRGLRGMALQVRRARVRSCVGCAWRVIPDPNVVGGRGP